MKQSVTGGEAIRLTNRTAKALRRQARRQQLALRLCAVLSSLALAALAIYLGMQRILYVPVILLCIIALDALLLMLARGRYLELTGQAVCTEAAARILRGESAEQQRIRQARRDLESIKADLSAHGAQREPDEEDDDLYGGAPRVTASVPAAGYAAPRTTVRVGAVSDGEQSPRRRRRQPRLQVLSGDEAR